MGAYVQRVFTATRFLPLISRRCLATKPNGPLSKYDHPKVFDDSEKQSRATFTALGSNIKNLRSPSEVSIHLLGDYKIGAILEEVTYTKTEPFVLENWRRNTIPLFLDTKEPIGKLTRIPSFWLRDHCRCEKCVNQDTMQKAFDTFSIPENVSPKTVTTEKEGLKVIWAHDEHVSLYGWEWLKKQFEYRGFTEPETPQYEYWGQEIGANPPSVHYDDIMATDDGVGKWTAKVRKYGFSYVDGCPIDPHKTQELLERISFIRPTHYGGFYDFTSDLTMKDTAYTSQALGTHTDTTYFTDPAGLQMFHLLSHTDGEGGASILIDGFNAERQLRTQNFQAKEILEKWEIPWHASGNEGINITPAKRFPVLNYSGTGKSRQLIQVRWNNDDRGTLGNAQSSNRWYHAAREFDTILKREDMQHRMQLVPGRPVIFDNWRVLHGRTEFTGKRRICGGYINHDDFISRWRNTNFSRAEILAQIL